jgi:cobalt-zinc-cadmium efflux system protein
MPYPAGMQGSHSHEPHAAVDRRHAHRHGSHEPQAAPGNDGRKLFWAFALTGGFAAIEFIGGWLSHSLTLMADAGHMVTDSASLALAWIALRFADMPSDRRRTYGYQRLQVLAAFVNSLLLLGAVAWLAVEAVQRLQNPAPVAGPLMLAIAAGGLVINVISLALLHRGEAGNLNIRAAYLHVVSDLLGSVMALAAAGIIMTTGWTRIDPILALVVACLIVRSAGSLMIKSAHILLEGTPDWLDIDELQYELRRTVTGVIDVHHVHVWCLTSQHPLLTLHARIQPAAAPATVLREIKEFLSRRYALDHSTIQLEAAQCADDRAQALANAAAPDHHGQ